MKYLETVVFTNFEVDLFLSQNDIIDFINKLSADEFEFFMKKIIRRSDISLYDIQFDELLQELKNKLTYSALQELVKSYA